MAVRIIMPVAIGVALMLGLPAHAQAAKTHTAKASPAAMSVKTAMGGERWTCASRATIEVAPVSFDVRGQAEGWVMVHREKGAIVASERVDDRQAEQLRRLPCGGRDSDLGGIAIG
jgi:hypothetical protein